MSADPHENAHTSRAGQARRVRRKNDPEGTRRAILAAAAEEFAQYGFAKARVTRIATSAGVAHQLVAYHFGGKKGLFEALGDEWLDMNRNLNGPLTPLVEMGREYVRVVLRDKAWARTMTRQSLDGGLPALDDRVASLGQLVDLMRARQQRGDLRDELDAGAVSLVLFAATIAPVIFPSFAAAFTGLDPASTDFEEHYSDQLGRFIALLADTR